MYYISYIYTHFFTKIFIFVEKKNVSTAKNTQFSDKNMTFGGGSCGPNGVLIKCHDSFGKNRINLFGESRKSTREFVDAFLLFRNTFIKDFFNLFVEHLNKDVFIKDFKTDPTKNNVLDDFMQSHYINTVSLFNKVKKENRNIIYKPFHTINIYICIIQVERYNFPSFLFRYFSDAMCPTK